MEVINLYPKPAPLDISPRQDDQVPLLENVNLYKVKNAYITSYGYVIKNFKVLYEAVSPRHRTAVKFKNLFAFLFIKKKIYIDTPCLSIANGWLDSYYHFTIESLPKLFLMKDYINKSTLIFHSDIARFHAEWFEIIGVKKIKYINDNEVIKTPLAITTSFTSQDLNFHHIIIPEFRLWLLEKIENLDAIKYDKVFVSRKNQRHRKLLNEAQVSDLLNKFGYVTLYMEDFSVSDQVRIFHNATKIICIHGALITNFCFSKRKTKILDLMHENFVQWSYTKLAILLEVDYEILRCEAADKKKHPGYDDITVNLLQLEERVASWSS